MISRELTQTVVANKFYSAK